MGIMNKVTDKIIKRQARKKFDADGSYCEHDPKHVCDKCLEEAIALAKEQAKNLTFKEKMDLLKGSKEQKKD